MISVNMTLDNYLSPQGKESLKRYKLKKLVSQAKKDTNPAYEKFQETYRGNWSDFARDCIDWKDSTGLTHYQNAIFDNFKIHDRQAVRGPRTLGKTAMAAILVLGWALTHDGLDWKVGTTASAWRQLELYLWPEIHKWAGRLKWDIIGRDPFNPRSELMTQMVRLSTGAASAIHSDDHEKMEGLHADYLLFIYDESKVIPDATWDALEGAFASAGEGGSQVAKVLSISTPGEPGGRFYDIHSKKPGYEDWYTIHITKEDAIESGRLTQSHCDQRLRQWGESSALYQNQILGEFAAQHEDVIIPLAWIESACVRGDVWRETLKAGAPKGVVTSMGLDIALGGKGNDKPYFSLVYDETHVEIEEFKPKTKATALMEIAGHAKGLLDRHNAPMYIDVIGLGAGVYSRLVELKLEKLAIPFNASAKVSKKLKDKSEQFTFKNARAALWLKGKEAFDPEESEVSLPRDSEVIGELTRTREKPILSDGVKQVEAKADIRKRSTDKADAVLQSLVGGVIAKRPTAQVYVAGKGYI
jgi:hypothetical protein